jgi:hypothetical protein
MNTGLHLTHSYFSTARLGAFYRERYPRPTGLLLRKHWSDASSLLLILWAERGPLVGLGLQLLLLAGIVTTSPELIATATTLACLDLCRFVYQGRRHEFTPVRIITPWLVIQGLLRDGEEEPCYQVHRVA